MKFSKFKGRRYNNPWKKYLIAQNKADYLANKGKVRVLDSLYTENKTWGALTKVWLAYVISKNRFELRQRNTMQRLFRNYNMNLGYPVTPFPDLNPYPLKEEGYSEEDIDRYYDVEYVSKQEMKEW